MKAYRQIIIAGSSFSVFHPASGWTSGWMMVVEAITCLCQWSKKGLLAVQIESSTAVRSGEDSQNKSKSKFLPNQSFTSVDAWIWGTIWRREEHLRCQWWWDWRQKVLQKSVFTCIRARTNSTWSGQGCKPNSWPIWEFEGRQKNLSK